MSKKPSSTVLAAEIAREHSRRMQKRALLAALCTIALTLLGFSFGIEENGGSYAKGNELPAVYGMNLYGEEASDGVCTAFLVHPELLFTAAHCLYNFRISDLSNAPDIRGSTRKYSNPKVKSTAIFPKFARLRPGLSGAHPDLMQSDFGYIRLKTPVVGITPLTIKGIHELPENGQFAYHGHAVTTTGYGVKISRGQGASYEGDTKGVKRYGSTTIQDTSSMMFTMAGLKGNILPGDSGGPLLLQENGQTFVIGVNQSILHGGRGGAYSESHALGLRKELVCWALKDTGLSIAGVSCP